MSPPVPTAAAPGGAPIAPYPPTAAAAASVTPDASASYSASPQPTPATYQFIRDAQAEIISAPFSGGQGKGGVELGPSHLLLHGLAGQLEGLGWRVAGTAEDQHAAATPSRFDHLRPTTPDMTTKVKNAEHVSAVTRWVCEEGKRVAARHALPITIGGDHSIGIGTVAASAASHPGLGVIWVDAHADINPPALSLSGNLHGCPLSLVTGLAPNTKHFEWVDATHSPDAPLLPLSRLVYIGLRDVDAAERRILREHRIKAFSMYEVDKYGIGEVMRMALDYLGHDCPVHLSFDVDALDPSVVPATGTPVRGGLTFREGHFICEELAASGQLVAMDLMEVNPVLGDAAAQQQTVEVGCSLIRAALGETLL